MTFQNASCARRDSCVKIMTVGMGSLIKAHHETDTIELYETFPRGPSADDLCPADACSYQSNVDSCWPAGKLLADRHVHGLGRREDSEHSIQRRGTFVCRVSVRELRDLRQRLSGVCPLAKTRGRADSPPRGTAAQNRWWGRASHFDCEKRRRWDGDGHRYLDQQALRLSVGPTRSTAIGQLKLVSP